MEVKGTPVKGTAHVDTTPIAGKGKEEIFSNPKKDLPSKINVKRMATCDQDALTKKLASFTGPLGDTVGLLKQLAKGLTTKS